MYFATCARGLGDVLAREVAAADVGGEVLDVATSGVRFAGDTGVTGYRACVWLRAAMRVLEEVRETAELEEGGGNGVYEFVRRAAPWAVLLDGGKLSFSVQVRVSVGAEPRKMRGRTEVRGVQIGEHAAQVRAKDAICDALRDEGYEKPPRPESHATADVPLFLVIHRGEATLYRDLAGASLHKRGYRSEGTMHRSSLNESVAAGMLYMAGFQPDGSFRPEKKKTIDGSGSPKGPLTIVDPMCGSATLLIEAALCRLHVAPGLYRRDFAFQRFADYDEAAYKSVMEAAVAAQRPDDAMGAVLIGNDINPAALALARRDLERTRLTGLISLHHADAQELALDSAPTLVICNPPWGLRLGGEMVAWETLGVFLRRHAAGTTAVFLSGDVELTRGLRMRARKKVPVRIGNVDTRVLTYDVLPKRAPGVEVPRKVPGQPRVWKDIPAPRPSEREMPML